SNLVIHLCLLFFTSNLIIQLSSLAFLRVPPCLCVMLLCFCIFAVQAFASNLVIWLPSYRYLPIRSSTRRKNSSATSFRGSSASARRRSADNSTHSKSDRIRSTCISHEIPGRSTLNGVRFVALISISLRR